MKKEQTQKRSVAGVVTERILELIEKTGELPWERPWMTRRLDTRPKNLVSDRHYHGFNLMLLSCMQEANGYSSPCWLTFKQATEKKGRVRKGEKGTPIIYYNMVEAEDRETGDEKQIPFLRYYTVFNIDQVDGIEAAKSEAEEVVAFNPIEEAEAIINAANLPRINFGGNKAYYSPSLDYIQMPLRDQFKSEANYYQTLFHEAAHSTGHASRLSRKGVTEASYFGSHEYSKEELVAEICAASLSHEVGIYQEIERNSAAYVKSWARVLEGDKNMIIGACGQAQKAFDYILRILPEVEKEQEKLAA